MQTKQLLLPLVAVLWLGVASAGAETTNAVQLAARAAQKSLDQIQGFLDQVSELELSVTNDAVRLECITDKGNKLKGLLELTRSAAGRLPLLIEEEDMEAAGAEQSRISIAAARAQKLAGDAEACPSSTVVKQKQRRRTTEFRPNPPARPPLIERDEENCLKQVHFAGLLVQVMELGRESQSPEQTPTDALAKLAIEPLGGWHPDDCTSLDDLCVTIARALNLKVESATDPVSYLDAMRTEGFPLEMFFPQRPTHGESPLLLESEVRAFLSKGYAAPLPTSRRLMPD